MVCECASLWPWKVHAVRARYRWSCIDPETEAVTQSLWKPGNPTLTIQPTAEVTEPLEKVEPRRKPGKRLNQNQLQGNIFTQILSHHFFSPTRFCWYAEKSAFLENTHPSPQQSAVSFINLMQNRVIKFRERTLLSCTVQVAPTRTCNSRV